VKTNQEGTVAGGELPAWRVGELPAPLPFNLRNCLRTIGPGAILLVGAIGMGEWVAGPLFAVQHGRGILWIATAAFLLQSVLNLEAVRYTLYTGEPITTGFMRLRPGPRVWGTLYAAAAVAQLGLPAGAAACAGIVFAMGAGRAPEAADAGSVRTLTIVLVVLSAALLASGRKVERTLERLSWLMIAAIFGFLVWANAVFVPAAEWGRTALGFLQPGRLPAHVDFVMLATFAALAGAGGVGNLAIASWFRDKGFAMGATSGSLGGVWATEQTMAPTGTVFVPTPENLRRWRGWWRYSWIDQAVLWAAGCVVGMFLTVNLAIALYTPGLRIDGVAAGVFQAAEMRKLWEGLWWLALLNGFWILFSTALTNVDILTRLVADILWAGNARTHRLPAGRLYGWLLLGFTLTGALGAFAGNARVLLGVLGATAAPITAFSALQILRVNTTLLPAPLRPPLWRRAGLVLCAVFYGAISLGVFAQLIGQAAS
jgi:hypothetical protein